MFGLCSDVFNGQADVVKEYTKAVSNEDEGSFAKNEIIMIELYLVSFLSFSKDIRIFPIPPSKRHPIAIFLKDPLSKYLDRNITRAMHPTP